MGRQARKKGTPGTRRPRGRALAAPHNSYPALLDRPWDRVADLLAAELRTSPTTTAVVLSREQVATVMDALKRLNAWMLYAEELLEARETLANARLIDRKHRVRGTRTGQRERDVLHVLGIRRSKHGPSVKITPDEQDRIVGRYQALLGCNGVELPDDREVMWASGMNRFALTPEASRDRPRLRLPPGFKGVRCPLPMREAVAQLRAWYPHYFKTDGAVTQMLERYRAKMRASGEEGRADFPIPSLRRKGTR